MNDFTAADAAAGFLPPLNLGYIRYSTDKQDFEVQRAAVLRGATYHELPDFEIIEEPATSRLTPFAEREGGAALLRKVETAHAEGRAINLIFPKVDRFGAGVVDISITAKKLESYGARLVFMDMNIDTSTVFGRAMMQISAIFAEMEVMRLRERTTEKMATKRRAGELIGSLTYGWNAEYTFRDGHTQTVCDRPLNQAERAAAEKDHGTLLAQMLVDNLEEQRWIRHMAAMDRGGASLAAIARDLNTRRVPTKMGVQRLKLRCSASTPGAVKSGKGYVIEKLTKGKWQVGNVEGVLSNDTVKAWLAA